MKLKQILAAAASAFLFFCATAAVAQYRLPAPLELEVPCGGSVTLRMALGEPAYVENVGWLDAGTHRVLVEPVIERADRTITKTVGGVLQPPVELSIVPDSVCPLKLVDGECSVSSASISSGQNATFTWHMPGASGCMVSNGRGVSIPFFSSGSVLAYSVTENRTFTVSCERPAASSCSATVTVASCSQDEGDLHNPFKCPQ